MKQFTFSHGRALQIDGQPFKIASCTENGQLELMAADGTTVHSTQDELLQKYTQRKLSFVESDAKSIAERLSRPLSTFSEAIQAAAIRRKKYIDFILQYGPFLSTPKELAPLIATCAESIGDANPPSASSIYRWNKKLVSAQHDARSLIGRSDLCGKAGSRLSGELQAMLQEAIDRIYLSPQRNTIEETWSYLGHLVAKANTFREVGDKLPVPSKSTVRRAIRSLDQLDTLVARYGSRIANMRFRTSGRGPQASRILERVEIDHTPLDLFVICNKTHLPMGRPTITLAIDKFSRMVLGIHIGFDGPSIEAVFACLRHAILPKSDLRREFPDIENPWPCYGAIEELICDNGLEFHAQELERVAFEISMILTFCPTRAPYYKGSVERFLKTVNYKFAHGLPGTSFARWFHREDYDSQKQAVIPFDVLRAILFRWIVDVYSQSIHRGIGTTPYAKWMEGTQKFTPALPISPERLDIALGRTCERTLSHAGIELFNLRYNAKELLGIRRQLGERTRVEVRYYAGDLSYINVIDPLTKEAITVPSLDIEYTTNLTLQQHRLICSHIRNVAKEAVNSASLLKAKAEIHQVVFEMATSKRQRVRQRANKLGWDNIPSESAVQVAPPVLESSLAPLQVECSSPITDLPRINTSAIGSPSIRTGELS